MIWTFADIKRIILDMALKVTEQPFTGNADFYQSSGNALKDDLGLDSIEIMALAADVNSFFNLFENEKPPYLLSSGKLDEWVNMVLAQNPQTLNFQSSGTSGQRKITRHSTSYLDREVSFLATLFSGADSVIPYVSSFTIYGFLLTIGLPAKLMIPVIYPSEINWHRLQTGALIVGTPFNWQLLSDSLPGMDLNCLGVSAGAPMAQQLYQQINTTGIKLTELYGATETAGVAYRQYHDQAFTVFPYWQLLPDGQVKDRQSAEVFMLMDDIQQQGQQTFTLLGRKDKQVKIAGKLVNLAEVAACIEKLSNVTQCILSAKLIGNNVILQAELSLVDDSTEFRDLIKSEVRRLLPAHERPQQIYFLSK